MSDALAIWHGDFGRACLYRLDRPILFFLDGEPVLSCLLLADAAAGRHVETVRGLAQGPQLHPLQEAFMERFAAQCGFCTPGMLMVAKALLDHNRNPTRAEVIEAISGNVCRCTGYLPIIEAILEAARRLSARG